MNSGFAHRVETVPTSANTRNREYERNKRLADTERYLSNRHVTLLQAPGSWSDRHVLALSRLSKTSLL
jgi:hypothetical protein